MLLFDKLVKHFAIIVTCCHLLNTGRIEKFVGLSTWDKEPMYMLIVLVIRTLRKCLLAWVLRKFVMGHSRIYSEYLIRYMYVRVTLMEEASNNLEICEIWITIKSHKIEKTIFHRRVQHAARTPKSASYYEIQQQQRQTKSVREKELRNDLNGVRCKCQGW